VATIVAIAGSIRAESHTRTALERALNAAESAGGDAELLGLRAFGVSPLTPDVDG
jgi:azobenzene reductase